MKTRNKTIQKHGSGVQNRSSCTPTMSGRNQPGFSKLGSYDRGGDDVGDAGAEVADAVHSFSALGIGGAILLGGKWTILDPAVCVIISIVIIVVAVKMAIPALAELTEASLPDETEARITSIIESVPGVDNAHELKTRRNGQNIIIDAHIVVDPEMTVFAAHEITTEVENAIRTEFGAETQVSIHVEPHVDSE